MNNYDKLEKLCIQADLDYGASECHAILAGLLCTTGASKPPHWLPLLYDTETVDSIPSNDRLCWGHLYESSQKQLSGNELNFQLLLPNDEEALSQRIEALTNWCRGFLYGISVGQLKLGAQHSKNVNEIIHDMTQISQTGYDDDDNDNEGEKAYMELCEYIRAGTMLIYNELQTQTLPSRDDAILH